VIPQAIATGNCDLHTECIAMEFLTDGRGRARGVGYFQGRQFVEQHSGLSTVGLFLFLAGARLLP